ncbi:hypothetical protein V8J88_25215 [Massilia sp. W12]|uniref:hypothetical protein n=1 Tax=Massilia sp. W12 TaxID=3126507 RepID=UPI0030CB04BF
MPKENETGGSTPPVSQKVEQRLQVFKKNMQTQSQMFQQKYPDLAQHLLKAKLQFHTLRKQGQQHASDMLDHAVQKTALSASSMTREKLKLKPNPDDWFHTRIKKAVFNKGVDLLADNMDKITKGVTHVGGGVKSKMFDSTLDMVDPRHLKQIYQNPHLAMRYLDQRVHQAKQFGNLIFDPKRFLNTKAQHIKTAFWNAKDHYGELDSGNKLKHGAHAFGDLVQDKMAGAIGMAIATMAVYNLPKPRKNTKAAMDKTFPKNTTYGKFFRHFPVKFMFSKPLAKIRGNKVMTAAMIGYGLAVGMGRHIGNSLELSKSAPNIHKRLKDEHREMHSSGRQLDVQKSIQRTSNGSVKK